MAQVVSRRPLTAEAPIRAVVSPCGICGRQSGTGIGCWPSSVLPSHCLSSHRGFPHSCIVWGMDK